MSATSTRPGRRHDHQTRPSWVIEWSLSVIRALRRDFLAMGIPVFIHQLLFFPWAWPAPQTWHRECTGASDFPLGDRRRHSVGGDLTESISVWAPKLSSAMA